MPDERTEAQSDDSAVRAAKKTWPARGGADALSTGPQPPTEDAEPADPGGHCPDERGRTAPLSDADVRLSQLLSQRVFAVPGYKPVRQLGQGTYGVVWLAEEETTGIKVAVKFFAHGAGEDWQMLQGEVRQLASLHDDPGIVELIDVGLSAFPPYYVMRYCEGGSLAQRLEKGPLPLEQALAIFRQICEALAYVH